MVGRISTSFAHLLFLGVSCHKSAVDIHQSPVIDHDNTASDACDWSVQSSTGAHVGTLEETMVVGMKVQLLQTDTAAVNGQDTNHFPDKTMTARQMRLQAQEKRRELKLSEQKKWNHIEHQNKEAIAHERLVQMLKQQMDKQVQVTKNATSKAAEELQATEEGSSDSSLEAKSSGIAQLSALRRQGELRRAVDSQIRSRKWALKQRARKKT